MNLLNATQDSGSQLGAEGVPHTVLDLLAIGLNGDALLAVDLGSGDKVPGDQGVLLAAGNEDSLVTMRFDGDGFAALETSGATTTSSAAATSASTATAATSSSEGTTSAATTTTTTSSTATASKATTTTAISTASASTEATASSAAATTAWTESWFAHFMLLYLHFLIQLSTKCELGPLTRGNQNA